MSSENSPPPSPNATRRRSSFSPGFTGLFSRPSNAGQSQPTNPYPNSIGNAANNAQRRSMTITTLGLATSPTQPSPFAKSLGRRSSISSSGSGSPQIDEDAIEDGDASAPQNTPATPFGRRLSFGAQALRDVRVGSGSTNGRRSISSTSTSPPVDTTAAANNTPKPNATNKSSNSSWSKIGEGLNWGEQLRARARAPSFSSPPTGAPAERPLPEIQKVPGVEAKQPAPPRRMAKPDYVGERMLRGDFDMG